ncbi:MAG TPA: translation initiation factor [Candidatus Thermoplasmatota archaeon]|nr:translation initiation factor [Candidatus Thermoplasmatota archaeon]
MTPKIGGLPDELDPFGDLEVSEAKFRLRVEARRYGKNVTVLDVEGLPDHAIADLTTELKSAVASGGTSRGQVIELQGDHRRKVREILERKGYIVES